MALQSAGTRIGLANGLATQSPGAEVYVCTEKATGKRFAIKEVDREKVRLRLRDEVRRGGTPLQTAPSRSQGSTDLLKSRRSNACHGSSGSGARRRSRLAAHLEHVQGNVTNTCQSAPNTPRIWLNLDPFGLFDSS